MVGFAWYHLAAALGNGQASEMMMMMVVVVQLIYDDGRILVLSMTLTVFETKKTVAFKMIALE